MPSLIAVPQAVLKELKQTKLRFIYQIIMLLKIDNFGFIIDILRFQTKFICCKSIKMGFIRNS